MKKILLTLIIFLCANQTIYSYYYLPDDISLSHVLIAISHNGPQSKEGGWRYAQQKGGLRKQWGLKDKPLARGSKINLHWRIPMSIQRQLAIKALWTDLSVLKEKINLKKGQLKLIGGFKKLKLQMELKKLQAQYEITKKLLPKAKPFIGLCHEGDGKNNCFLSATLQKKGEIDKAEDYFYQFAQLLKENPKDIAIIILEDYYLQDRSKLNGADKYTPEQVKQKLNEILKRSGLAKYAFKLDEKYYPKANHPAMLWPTVGELRISGKRLIIFTEEPRHFDSPYLNKTHGDPFRRTTWEFDWKKDLGKTCKMRFNNPGAKMFMVDHGPEYSIPKGSKGGKIITLIEKLGKKIKAELAPVETTDYKYLNSVKVINKRLEDCTKASPGTPPTILLLDFVEKGNLSDIIRKINMERIKKYRIDRENY